MRLEKLTWFSDFMQVLHSKRKHTTKNEHFPIHILFSTIYLLQEQKLTHNKYDQFFIS
jgi:predicted N-acyltransferase